MSVMTGYKLISADSHIVEPPDLYTTRIEPRFRNRAPRLERLQTPGGRTFDSWVVDGQPAGTLGAVIQAGQRFEDPSQIDFLGVWEEPSTREPLLVIVRSALTAEPAAAALREFVFRELLTGIASELNVPDPRLRAELAASQMVGLVILRYVLRVEPLASADLETLVRFVAPTVQRYLTEQSSQES